MVRKDIFLDKKSLSEAIKIWSDALSENKVYEKLGEEEISSLESSGRVTSREVYSKRSSPSFNASAVDGFALKADSTEGANLNNPKYLEIGTEAIYVNTGDAIDNPFDAVVMLEDIELVDSKIRLFQPVSSFQNVRMIGEDLVTMDVILRPNELIRPEHVGALVQGGVGRIFVKKKPKILIIPTGEEIRKPFESLSKGEYYDSNSYMISSIAKDLGAEVEISDILPNNADKIVGFLNQHFNDSHLFIIIGGSAKGDRDLVGMILKKIGIILLHGVSIQPGKPILLGFYKQKPVIGMPGFPVSAYIDTKIFVKIAIEFMQGLSGREPFKINVKVKRPISSQIGVEEFIRVKLGNTKEGIVAVPLKKGASPISSVSNADGFLRIASDIEGIEANSEVEIELIRDISEIRNQVLFIGSNDPMLDEAFNIAFKNNRDFSIGVVNSGSLGGLLALERGECPFTSTHLFDERTGTYNETYIRQIISKEVETIKFLKREQGLIVQKGNPRNIRGIRDLLKGDVVFINRQQGSGTRVFFDYLLREEKINPTEIKGYNNEELTHISVANAIKIGVADCGLGIHYVAEIFDLDFIPIQEEEYDLVFDKEYLNNYAVIEVLKVINSDKFKNFVRKSKGYKFVESF